jgi:Icc-related predicted phosphoesterase
MPVSSDGRPVTGAHERAAVRIAAAGDIHVGEGKDLRKVAAAFADVAGRVDLILLAGDLTTHGEPEQGACLADAVRDVGVPILTVLGNHDWHTNQRDELVAALEEGGIRVLDRSHCIVTVAGVDVGIAGVKGFVGGFPGSHLPDFGEPLLRAVYRTGMEEVAALDAGLQAIALCPLRIALLHYAPVSATLVGERETIWTMLGTDRLASPITEHLPDLVLHGHAHAGTFQGDLCGVPVYNVAVPVMGRDFWEFELSGDKRMPSEVH